MLLYMKVFSRRPGGFFCFCGFVLSFAFLPALAARADAFLPALAARAKRALPEPGLAAEYALLAPALAAGAEKAERLCLPLSSETVLIDDAADLIHSLADAQISPDGRHILYRRKKEGSDFTPLTLLDLETKEKEDFFFDWTAERPGFLNYGFSKDGLKAYAILTNEQLSRQRDTPGDDPAFSHLRERNYIKARRLFEGKDKMIPMPSGLVLSAGLSASRSKMTAMSVSKEHVERMEELDRLGLKDEERRFMQNLPVKISVLDMDSGSVSEDEIKLLSPDENETTCHAFNESQGIVKTRRDGSMYAKSFGKTAGGADKKELFGPLEGIRVKSYADYSLARMYPNETGGKPRAQWNCVFLDENTVLMANERGQLIVRRIKEREQFIFEQKDALGGFDYVYSDAISSLEFMLNRFRSAGPSFPFFLGIVKKEGGEPAFSSYHIPTGAFQLIERDGLAEIRAGREGRFALETRIVKGLEDGQEEGLEDGQRELKKTAAVLNPFEPEKRRLLREWDQSEICHQSFNEDKSLAFVNTIYGDLFVIDGYSGISRRRFIGGCLDAVKISDDGSAIVLMDQPPWRGGRGPFVRRRRLDQTQRAFKVRKFQEKCFQRLSSLPGGAAASLRRLAEADDPSDSKLLAVLAKAAEDGEALEKYPDLIRGALWNIFLSYPGLYRHLHSLYPGLQGLPPFPAPFLDGEESKARARLALKAVFQLSLSFRYSRLSEWGFVKNFQPIIHHALSESEREFYIGQITESVSNGAALAVPLFQDVFQSKIYYTARGHVQELFGLPREPVSDLTVVRRKHSIITVILSSDPIQNHPFKASDFGVYYAVVGEASRKGLFDLLFPSHASGSGGPDAAPPPPLRPAAEERPPAPIRLSDRIRTADPFAGGDRQAVIDSGGGEAGFEPAGPAPRGSKIFDGWINWGLEGGASYRAHLRIQAKPPDFIKRLLSNRKKSPDYQDVWSDRRMTGIMIIGSSLRPFSKTLVEEYVSYFEGGGFRFESIEAPGFKPFFLEKISSCELDYFLKESHSDGDERNVFRFNSDNHILRGSRHDSRGEREVIYLAFPPPFYMRGKPRTELLSNHELGQAIAERERAGCGEITYFNTSCWAHVKARSEIEAVGSDLFLNIPSQSMSDTFLNEKGDAIRELIHSYRQGLDFEGFRRRLRQNKGYASGKINDYIFPDESRYIGKIFQHIAVPMDIQIDLERQGEGGAWRAISPDEAL